MKEAAYQSARKALVAIGHPVPFISLLALDLAGMASGRVSSGAGIVALIILCILFEVRAALATPRKARTATHMSLPSALVSWTPADGFHSSAQQQHGRE
ncbi:hypothetical protein [Ralstonia pseudosolanacearum]|uniref:hypothetical protein n=1 Tax=Ralstonia pseudosolanacearum TaxID=1310165 RepID=UPI003CF6DCE5